MVMKQSGRISISLIVLLVVIALSMGLFWKRNTVMDYVRLLGYEPSSQIEELTERTTMTKDGEHMFYINRPATVTKAKFAQKCPAEEKTIVLGCYHSVQNGIYVLRITDDPRLDGVMEVTAAHEMLHAAYDRLADDERERIHTLLRDYYHAHQADERIQEALKVYASLDDEGIANEMHSILGTEIELLPVKLERYYKQYFKDRSQIVAMANSYRAEFTSREDAVKSFEAQLKVLKAQIQNNRSRLMSQRARIEAESAELSRLRQGGDVATYNARVDGYNSLVRSYNTLIETTKVQIAQYNELVEQRNTVALDYEQLGRELSGVDLETIQ